VLRLFCAMILVVSCCAPAAAIGPDDPAATYYEKCVAAVRVPDKSCDDLITNALMGIIIGQFNQKHADFCYPQESVDQMQVKMREAVARYMREHPERLSEKTILVRFAALLHAFPCRS
jgi:hypothetical protein